MTSHFLSSPFCAIPLNESTPLVLTPSALPRPLRMAVTALFASHSSYGRHFPLTLRNTFPFRPDTFSPFPYLLNHLHSPTYFFTPHAFSPPEVMGHEPTFLAFLIRSCPTHGRCPLSSSPLGYFPPFSTRICSRTVSPIIKESFSPPGLLLCLLSLFYFFFLFESRHPRR